MLSWLAAAAFLTGGGTLAPVKTAVVIGTVEARTPADADFKPLAAGASIDDQTWVRTGPKSKAAFELADGSEVRVNEKSEVLIHAGRKLEIKVGEVFVKVSAGPVFDVKCQFTTAQCDPGLVDISFVHRDPADPARNSISKTVTTVQCYEGKVRVPSRRYTQNVDAGYMCHMMDSQLNTPERAYEASLSSAWVHEILAARGPGNAELLSRAKELVRMLGSSRAAKAEEVLKTLGEHATPALVEALKAPPKTYSVAARRASAKLLAASASASSAGDLVAGLKDADVEVRVDVAKGLARISGGDFSYDEKYWRGTDTASGVKAWEDWAKKLPGK
jgi:hypothetical protein